MLTKCMHLQNVSILIEVMFKTKLIIWHTAGCMQLMEINKCKKF